MSDIIKNPNRKNSPVRTEPLQPEYARLGITPRQAPTAYGSQMNALSVGAPKRGGNISVPSPVRNLEQENGSKSVFPVNMNDNSGLSIQPFPEYDELSEAVENGEDIDLDQGKNQDDQQLPEVGQYILMIEGEIICTGNLYAIQSRAQNILYGDDLDYQDISQENLVVLKRVDLKVGVYIQE